MLWTRNPLPLSSPRGRTMDRNWAFLLAVPLVLLVAGAGTADNAPTLQQVEALNQTLQRAAQAAEPAIACILVSRSDVYRKRFDDTAPPDDPGRLGPFPQRPVPNVASDRLVRPDEAKRHDLSDPEYVPES